MEQKILILYYATAYNKGSEFSEDLKKVAEENLTSSANLYYIIGVVKKWILNLLNLNIIIYMKILKYVL